MTIESINRFAHALPVTDMERDQAKLRIVDAHFHLWDLQGQINYDWLVHPEHNWLGDYSAFQRTYLAPEYIRATSLHNLVGAVAIEAECDRSQQVPETAFFTLVNEQYGLPSVIVAHAWVDTPNAEEIIAQQAAFKLVRGIRTKPIIAAKPGESVRGQSRSLQDPKWITGLGLLEKYKLSWDLRLPWWHLEEGAEVAALYPNMPVVLNHTGYPWNRDKESMAQWRKGMQALAKLANVSCKISGLCVSDRPWTLEENGPIIRETIEMFGVDRCMFASNFPVDSLKGSWDYVYTCFKRSVAHLSIVDQQKLFADNAIRVYRIH
jgi:predicted TIM-barrel fold metal-dependent hydrolase